MRCKVPGTNDIRSKMVESKIGQVMTNKYCIYIYLLLWLSYYYYYIYTCLTIDSVYFLDALQLQHRNAIRLAK